VTQTTSRLRLPILPDQAVMSGEPSQRDLKDAFAGSLRPAILLLGVFEALSARSKYRPARPTLAHSHERTQHPLFGGDHVIAQRCGV
jgi:hypothetical protein